MSRPAGSVARASGLVAAVTMASRLLGFARWLAFSAAVGAGTVGTAYGSANSVPNVLYEVAAGGALAAAVVPLVGSALARDCTDERDRLASALLTWSLAVLVPLAVVLWLLAGPVAGLLVPADAADRARTLDLTATMLRWFAPQIPLYGVGVVATGVLQAHRRFAAAALAPLLSSVVVIGTYLAYGRLRADVVDPGGTAVALLAGGTTLGVVALSLPLLVPVRRLGVRLRPTLALPDGAARRVRSLAGAGVAALLAQQLAVLATIRVANAGDGAGTLNVVQYGQAVYLLPYAVLAVPVATAVFPALAQDATVDTAAAAPRLAGALRVVAVASGLGCALLVGAAGPLGRFFAAIDAGRHGGAGLDIATGLRTLVLALAPGLVGYGLAALLTRALYVRGRPRTAAGWVAAGWVVAGLVPLVVVLGMSGQTDPVRRLLVLGLASSAGMTLTAVGLVAAVRAAWPESAVRGLGRSTAAAAVAAMVGGAAGAVVDRLLAGATGSAAGAVLAGLACAAVAGAVGVLSVGLVDRSAAAGLAARMGRRRG